MRQTWAVIKWFGGVLPEFNPEKAPLFVAKSFRGSFRGRKGSTNFNEKVIFPNLLAYHPFLSRFFVSLRPMSPRPTPPDSGGPGERPSLDAHTISRAWKWASWQKNWGGKEKWMVSRSLGSNKASQQCQKVMDRIAILMTSRNQTGGIGVPPVPAQAKQS